MVMFTEPFMSWQNEPQNNHYLARRSAQAILGNSRLMALLPTGFAVKYRQYIQKLAEIDEKEASIGKMPLSEEVVALLNNFEAPIISSQKDAKIAAIKSALRTHTDNLRKELGLNALQGELRQLRRHSHVIPAQPATPGSFYTASYHDGREGGWPQIRLTIGEADSEEETGRNAPLSISQDHTATVVMDLCDEGVFSIHLFRFGTDRRTDWYRSDRQQEALKEAEFFLEVARDIEGGTNRDIPAMSRHYREQAMRIRTTAKPITLRQPRNMKPGSGS